MTHKTSVKHSTQYPYTPNNIKPSHSKQQKMTTAAKHSTTMANAFSRLGSIGRVVSDFVMKPTQPAKAPSAPARPKPAPRAAEVKEVKVDETARALQYAAQDGVDHINIGGNTELGKLLAHYAYTPFTHPHFGPFNCMEGFWHFIRLVERDDVLRSVVGHKAKTYGKNLPRKAVPEFKDLVIEANFYKIEQNPKLLALLMDSKLRFDHYYLFGEAKMLIRPKGYEWLIQGFEDIRTMFKEGRRPTPVDYTKL